MSLIYRVKGFYTQLSFTRDNFKIQSVKTFHTVRAIDAFCDTLNSLILPAFLYKCDTVNLLDPSSLDYPIWHETFEAFDL